MNIDLKELSAQVQGQFQGLAGRHPGMWPLVPRLAVAMGVIAGVVALGYFGYWSGQFEDEEKGQAEELKLKDEFKTKLAQAINLDALRAQKVQVDHYVDRLQKQLPSKAEMAALLSDINTAGVGRGLTFNHFKPGGVVVKDYYAELPIDLSVVGSYHDVGSFASDMANLPRIVTLNNMVLEAKDGVLTLNAVAKTFRYLDPDEVAAQRKAANDKAREKKAAEAGNKPPEAKK